MIMPTQEEVRTLMSLHEEFKEYRNSHKDDISDEVIEVLIKPLASDDPMRVHAERLRRYNRYSRMMANFGGYLLQKLIDNKVQF